MECYWKRGSEGGQIPERLPKGITEAAVCAVYEAEQGKGTARCYFTDISLKGRTKEQLEAEKREWFQMLYSLQCRRGQETQTEPKKPSFL